MHTIPELGTGVPAFLAKLWKLVEDPETDNLICWSPNGRSFYIRNQAQFARELLPHYYKHNNMASFVRQLNMYGFHKKVSVELGGLKCDRDEMEFAHQYFYKGHPYLVEHIKRKIASNKGQDPALTPIKPELMNKMLTEVRSMRGRQEHLDSRLGSMKRENEALWREIAMLRQKHLKQQQIVNKLIHFLVTLVQPSRSAGLSVKRRYPLMIDDSNHQCKGNKISKAQTSPTGPVIHELDSSEPDLDSGYIVADILDNQPHPAIESPEHPNNDSSFIDDDGMETIQLVDNAVHFQNDDISLEMDTKKKRPCKGKKKRKNKMPVKILIPPTENGQESREEIHYLEIPTVEDSPVTVALLENNTIASKPVPLATVRSSKLAAMAANMSKSNEVETNVDLETTEIDDDIQGTDPSLEKLKDILIVPEVINNNDLEIDDNKEENIDNNSDNESIRLQNDLINMNKEQNILDEDNQIVADKSEASNLLEQQKHTCNKPDRSDPVDLSLSCVNPSGISGANYREEMDNHLETMQSELENLRDILRGEGYSIDANTLLGVNTFLGLFGTDDSSMPFGISVNSDLDMNDDREDDKSTVADSLSGNGGGELMAYNPAPNLLDFDDDIFLNATAASPVNNSVNDVSSSNLYASDPLDLEDSKASLLESYVGSNENDS
ncbi:PREDICTED: heat shock factor protein 1-like isoform X2 [Polistes canadensis]|uniref:heat shock factor protein 1-like isoform X2 n=1 Tax=Polistes canadensis TaxID=91411 RepID=UPI000718B8D5|nr:PREDICTED: heat shock factor protein 1-like isoform X2 [Polistes canadensis]